MHADSHVNLNVADMFSNSAEEAKSYLISCWQLTSHDRVTQETPKRLDLNHRLR